MPPRAIGRQSLSLPFVPGHEGAGIIAACGPGVVGLKEGDHAGVAWLHDACGQCEYCMTGWDSLCHAQHNTGYSVNGSFAEYVIGAAPYVGRLPEKADFAEMAPILCAGVTTYKGIKETEARPGEWLAISGIGGLGQLAVQYAKAMGLHVAALDITEDKLALARASGAEITLNAKSPDAAEQLVKRTGGGAHGVLVTAVSPAAFAQALKMVRRKGTISLVGLPPGEFRMPIFDVVMNRITIRGSIVGGREDLAEAIAFAAEGKVQSGNPSDEARHYQPGVLRPQSREDRRPSCADDVTPCFRDELATAWARVVLDAPATTPCFAAWNWIGPQPHSRNVSRCLL